MREAKAFSDHIKNNEFETMKVFEQQDISLTQPTLENISLTRPTSENISMTPPNSLTEPLTQLTDFPQGNG